MRPLVRGVLIVGSIVIIGPMVIIGSIVAAQAGSGIAQRPRQSADLTLLVSSWRASLNEFWLAQVLNFKPPTALAAYVPDLATEPCGPTKAQNAYYCPDDRGIYYDVAYLERWRSTIGDHAALSTLAHEWGHSVQDHLSLLDASAGLFSVQRELMADCLAGAYFRAVDARTPLSDAIKRQLTLKLTAVGDRGMPVYDLRAHGRPGQRLDAFQEGMDGRACTSEDFFRAIGIDRDAIQLAPPARGSVRARLRPQIARFTLADARWTPSLVSGALEALDASYRSAARVELDVTLTAFSSAAQTSKYFDAALAALSSRGYTEARRSRVTSAAGTPASDLGVVVVLQGPAEIVIWTQGTMCGAVEGPRDHVWEFVTAFL